MNLFGYGSLMDNDSLKKTIPDAVVVGPFLLKGYKRVFDFKSPSRCNKNTNIFSCVLNIKKDENYDINGVLITLPNSHIEDLVYRETGYEIHDVCLNENVSSSTFIALDYEKYEYVFNDPIQEEYLKICINAAKSFGEDFLDNFLSTTFIGDETIKTLGLF